jgi:hypothetical protein
MASLFSSGDSNLIKVQLPRARAGRRPPVICCLPAWGSSQSFCLSWFPLSVLLTGTAGIGPLLFNAQGAVV